MYIVARRLALQQAVVVVDPHVADLVLIADVDTVADIELRRGGGAGRRPDETVVGLRGGADEGDAAIEAGGMQVVEREVARRRCRRHILDNEDKGGRTATVGVLGGDKVAPGGECLAVGGACHGGTHGQIAVAEVVGPPGGGDGGLGMEVAAVGGAYLLLPHNGKVRPHGDNQLFGIVRAAVKEVATVADTDVVGAHDREGDAHLVAVLHVALRHGRRGYLPVVARGAEERQAVDRRFAEADIPRSLDNEAILDDRHLDAQHGRAYLRAAEHAVEAQHPVTVTRPVPLHRGVAFMLSAKQRAAVDMPIIFFAGGAGHRIGDDGTLAHRAIALQHQRLALQHLNVIFLLVVTAAVVVDAVDDDVVNHHVVDDIARRGRRSGLAAFPVVAGDVAAAVAGLVDKLHPAVFADAYDLLAVSIHRVGRHGGGSGGGGGHKLHIGRRGAVHGGGAVGDDDRHHQQAPAAVAPVDNKLVAQGAVRHVARHLPDAGHHGKGGRHVGGVGHPGVLAGHQKGRVLVERLVLERVQALRVEIACDDDAAGILAIASGSQQQRREQYK